MLKITKEENIIRAVEISPSFIHTHTTIILYDM